jgi:aqualysin 1
MKNRITRFMGFVGLMVIISSITAIPPATGKAQDEKSGKDVNGKHIQDLSGPIVDKFLKTENALPDQYIVVLQDWAAGPKGANSLVATLATDLLAIHGGTIGQIYQYAIPGFSVSMPEAAARLLSLDPRVAFVEEDSIVEVSQAQTPAPWGLDRIDQRNLPLNNIYLYTATGAGVKVYVIGTGIRFSHTQFGGRAVSGFDAIDGGSADDCNGHSTHVAGIVGGATYGVAKGVSLVAVRVADCNGSGPTSGVIAGVDWVSGNHAPGQPAVANMSLSVSASTALDTAVNNSIADGVTYVVAAGNNNSNACSFSPGRVANAITVGATNATDTRASFSNFGACLDLFAPGVSITSAWLTSDTATNTITGTSMAAPHVAGVVALYLQLNPSSSPQAVRDAIVNSATQGVVTNPGSGSPNRLLYSLLIGVPPPPPPPANCNSETYTGTLSGTGATDIQPNGTYFQSSAGTHYACLTGPLLADFDLYLYRWNGSSWSQVAISQGLTSIENITYIGTTGYYYWRVYSYRGNGSYTLRIRRP